MLPSNHSNKKHAESWGRCSREVGGFSSSKAKLLKWHLREQRLGGNRIWNPEKRTPPSPRHTLKPARKPRNLSGCCPSRPTTWRPPSPYPCLRSDSYDWASASFRWRQRLGSAWCRSGGAGGAYGVVGWFGAGEESGKFFLFAHETRGHAWFTDIKPSWGPTRGRR